MFSSITGILYNMALSPSTRVCLHGRTFEGFNVLVKCHVNFISSGARTCLAASAINKPTLNVLISQKIKSTKEYCDIVSSGR